MIIECPACSSRYRIREDKLPEAGGNIKCPNCAHVFFVARDGVPSDAPPGATTEAGKPGPTSIPPAAEPAAEPVADGEKRWKLKNPVGLIYDFQDTDQLRGWLRSRESFDGVTVSSDAGTTWAAVKDVPELADVSPTGRRAVGPQAVPFQGEDKPAKPANLPSSAEQMREEAQARLAEARRSREIDAGSVSAAANFQMIKPASSREEARASKVLLALSIIILPLIAGLGMHIVGVIDLSDFGLLPEKVDPNAYRPPPTRTITEDPSAPDEAPRQQVSPEQAVQRLMNQAANASARGDDDEAIELLEAAAGVAPDDPSLQCLLGPLYRAAGRSADADQALAVCRAADEAPEGSADGSGQGQPTPE